MTDSAKLFSETALPSLQRAQTRPVASALARWLGAVLLGLLMLLLLSPWQQNVRGMGRVIAYAPAERQQSIDVPVEGRLARWLVREGARVRAGEVLAELSDNDPLLLQRIEAEQQVLQARRIANEGRVEAARQQLRMAELARPQALSSSQSRARMAEERRRAAGLALSAAEAAAHTSRLNLERQDRLFSKGLSSRRNFELAQLDLTQKGTDAERAKASLRAAESESAAFQADLRKLEADTTSTIEKGRADLNKVTEELNYLQADVLKLETRLARQRTQTVLAPRDGVVFRLLANPGAELNKAGEPLLILIPDTAQPAVEVWVDGNDAPLITPGSSVRLQFEGYPSIQFSGWPELAVGSFGAKVAYMDATDDGKGRFRLVATPDPGDIPWPSGRFLRQGARVNAWVLLARVSLGYELWRIFNGFPPIVLPDSSATAPKSDAGAYPQGYGDDK